MTWMTAALLAITAAIGGFIGAALSKDPRSRMPRLTRQPGFWSSWGPLLVLLTFLAGFISSSFLLWNYHDDAGWWVLNRSNMEAIGPWLGEFISSFAPWGIIFLTLLVFPVSRNAISQVIRAPGDLVSGLGSSLSDGASITSPWVTVERKLSKLRADDYEQWAEIFSEQRKAAKKRFDKLTEELIRKNEVNDKLIDFCKDYLFSNLINENDSSARCAIHIRDLHFDHMLYQLTEYYFENNRFSTKRRSRRFSIRHGIIGKSFRKREFYLDQQVSKEPEDLIDTWGFTPSEAPERGKERQTHLALPIFVDTTGDPNFIIFCDAEPENAFFGSEGSASTKEELKGALLDGLHKTGLKDALFKVWLSLADEPMLFPIHKDSE